MGEPSLSHVFKEKQLITLCIRNDLMLLWKSVKDGKINFDLWLLEVLLWYAKLNPPLSVFNHFTDLMLHIWPSLRWKQENSGIHLLKIEALLSTLLDEITGSILWFLNEDGRSVARLRDG